MIRHEQEYLGFIRQRGVGSHDKVASSPDSYVSYLRSVSKLIGQDIAPETVRTEADVCRIVRQLEGRRAANTIRNYRSALRQYVAYVSQTDRKPGDSASSSPVIKPVP